MNKRENEERFVCPDESTVELNLNRKVFFENRIATDQVVSLGSLKWLTTSEAAQYLRVSVGSIKNMVYRGLLSPRKLGRLNRFLREDLDRVIRVPFQTKGGI